ncbi:MAG: pseudouridine synthase, partial [Agathobacter sp.]
VDETKDVICFKSQPISYEKYVYYLFHKPAGCVTAKQDNVHQTVMDFFPEEICAGIAPVGRLDLDTEGLLLLTNDGPLTHHLLSPTHHIPKTYYAILDREVPSDAAHKFREGVDIGDDKPTLPAELLINPILENKAGERIYSAELTVHEGRFHQVKRMFEAVGCTVTYLKRISMGSLTLGDLPKGEYRKLTLEEVEPLKK